jgi:hypothetical protein
MYSFRYSRPFLSLLQLFIDRKEVGFIYFADLIELLFEQGFNSLNKLNQSSHTEEWLKCKNYGSYIWQIFYIVCIVTYLSSSNGTRAG